MLDSEIRRADTTSEADFMRVKMFARQGFFGAQGAFASLRMTRRTRYGILNAHFVQTTTIPHS